MNKILAFVLGFILHSVAFGQDIIIRDIGLIPMTSNTSIKKQSVLLRDGKIEQIGAFKNLPKNKKTQVINGQGKYLMPGLADMHVHLPEAERVDTVLLLNVAAGVTHIRVMNSRTSQPELQQRLASSPPLRTLKVHYSSIIHRDKSYTPQQLDSLVIAAKRERIDFIKLFSLSDEATFDHLMKAANTHQLTVCGHYPTYQQDGQNHMLDMEKVLTSNFKSIEHLAGYSWLADEDQLLAAIQLTKANKVYNCPTLDWDVMANHLQYPEAYKNRLTYALLPEYTQNWERNYATTIEKAGGKEQVLLARDKSLPGFERKIKILKMLYENDCLLLIGGDAGSDFQADGFNVYEEMLHWQQAGIDNYTILKSATSTAAMFFNEQDKWGTIEKGKDADLIILRKNPLEDIQNISTVEATIVQGKVYQTADILKEL